MVLACGEKRECLYMGRSPMEIEKQGKRRKRWRGKFNRGWLKKGCCTM